MQVNVRRGISRRTCFALEFVSRQQRYMSVAQFVNENVEFLRDTLQQHAPPRFKLHMIVEAEFQHSTDVDQQKKWHLSTAAVPVDINGLIDYFNDNAVHLDEKIAQYSALGSG